MYISIIWVTKILLNDIPVANRCGALMLMMSQYKFEIKHMKKNVADKRVYRYVAKEPQQGNVANK